MEHLARFQSNEIIFEWKIGVYGYGYVYYFVYINGICTIESWSVGGRISGITGLS